MPVVAERAAARAEAMLPRPCRVIRVTRETADTVTLAVEDPAGGAFRPGQFMMLLAPGVGEIPISISGNPAQGPLLQTVRAVGATSRALAAMPPDATVGVRGPFGSGWPVDLAEGSDVLLVGGGIGWAPLRPVLLHVLAHRERYGRVAVLIGARSPQDLLFRRELEKWRGRLDVDVAVTVDSAPGDWRGDVGLVTRLIPRAPVDPTSTVAMLCGPEVMMRFAAVALIDLGIPAEDVWVSLERNMMCGVALCGHCQLGPLLICREGPVLRLDRVTPLWSVREL
jgi:NAD(P)H-flavin reductase